MGCPITNIIFNDIMLTDFSITYIFVVKYLPCSSPWNLSRPASHCNPLTNCQSLACLYVQTQFYYRFCNISGGSKGKIICCVFHLKVRYKFSTLKHFNDEIAVTSPPNCHASSKPTTSAASYAMRIDYSLYLMEYRV